MKAISTPLIITSIRSKVDGSLGFSATTPEISNKEKVAFFELQNKNLEVVFSPLDEPETETIEVKKELGTKTQSQRLRNLIYVIFNETKTDDTFSIFYEKMMDKIIEGMKRKYLE